MPKIGAKYNRLTVIRQLSKSKFMLSCDCGAMLELFSSQFLKGANKSCGCLNKEKRKGRFTTHGESKTRLYITWKNMKARCYSKAATHYETYGGRGITVCAEWRDNYLSFKNWAYANGYEDSLTIDRKDNDGGYSPDNCRWITSSENVKLMNIHHIKHETGSHSIKAREKVKKSNRENHGVRISLQKDSVLVSFDSIGEAADYLSSNLGRERQNVYSHLKQLNKGKVLQVGGWKIANT